MTKEKMFPLKISSTKQGALKEDVSKHIADNSVKIKLVYGLDSELRLVEPAIYSEGVFLEAKTVLGQQVYNLQDFLNECKRTENSIFYPLDNLMYICVHNIVLEKGQPVKNAVSLYIPVNFEKSKLLCKDVTIMIPRQTRKSLADKYFDFVVNRV